MMWTRRFATQGTVDVKELEGLLKLRPLLLGELVRLHAAALLWDRTGITDIC